MRYTTNAVILVSLFAVNALAVPLHHFQPIQRPPFQETLNKRIDGFDGSGRTLAALILDLAYEHKIPLAFEYVDRPAVTEPVDIHLKNSSIRDIIEAAVGRFPEYRVSFSADLINIYSPAARQDRSNVLNTPISNFSVKELDTHRADMELFCAVVQATHGGACTGSIAVGQWGPLKVSVSKQNAKVYEILNAIVAQNSQAVWIVTAPANSLSEIPVGGLWHIYPLDNTYQSIVLEKLTSVGSH